MQPEMSTTRRTPRTVSIVLGIAGGALDLGVGLWILATAPMVSRETGMGVTWGYMGAILLLLLGGVVLGSTVQMIGMRKTPRRRSEGFLMIVYGVLMLSAGLAMLGRVLPMMQASDASGGAMIAVGLGMLYVGATMRRIHMSFRRGGAAGQVKNLSNRSTSPDSCSRYRRAADSSTDCLSWRLSRSWAASSGRGSSTSRSRASWSSPRESTSITSGTGSR